MADTDVNDVRAERQKYIDEREQAAQRDYDARQRVIDEDYAARKESYDAEVDGDTTSVSGNVIDVDDIPPPPDDGEFDVIDGDVDDDTVDADDVTGTDVDAEGDSTQENSTSQAVVDVDGIPPPPTEEEWREAEDAEDRESEFEGEEENESVDSEGEEENEEDTAKNPFEDRRGNTDSSTGSGEEKEEKPFRDGRRKEDQPTNQQPRNYQPQPIDVDEEVKKKTHRDVGSKAARYESLEKARKNTQKFSARFAAPKFHLNPTLSPEERFNSLMRGHQLYARDMALSCVEPLRNGVDASSVMAACSTAAVMWLAHPDFRKTGEAFNASINKKLFEKTGRPLLDAANKMGKAVKDSYRRAEDKRQRVARGKDDYLITHEGSAARVLVRGCDEYYRDMRAPGADRAKLKQDYAQFVKYVEAQVDKDGGSVAVMRDKARDIVAERMAEDPTYASHFEELSSSRVQPSSRRKINGKWSGEWKNTTRGGNLRKGSEFFTPRIPDKVGADGVPQNTVDDMGQTIARDIAEAYKRSPELAEKKLRGFQAGMNLDLDTIPGVENFDDVQLGMSGKGDIDSMRKALVFRKCMEDDTISPEMHNAAKVDAFREAYMHLDSTRQRGAGKLIKEKLSDSEHLKTVADLAQHTMDNSLKVQVVDPEAENNKFTTYEFDDAIDGKFDSIDKMNRNVAYNKHMMARNAREREHAREREKNTQQHGDRQQDNQRDAQRDTRQKDTGKLRSHTRASLGTQPTGRDTVPNTAQGSDKRSYYHSDDVRKQWEDALKNQSQQPQQHPSTDRASAWATAQFAHTNEWSRPDNNRVLSEQAKIPSGPDTFATTLQYDPQRALNESDTTFDDVKARGNYREVEKIDVTEGLDSESKASAQRGSTETLRRAQRNRMLQRNARRAQQAARLHDMENKATQQADHDESKDTGPEMDL